MATGIRHDIDLPLHEARDTAMLLDVARPIPVSELLRDGVNRFAAGVEWSLWPAIEHHLDPAECDTVYDKQPAEFDDFMPDQPAFTLWERLAVSSRCSSERAGEYLRASFTDFLSPVFASELETGAGSNGMGLVGNVTYPPTIVASSAVSLDVALARLEKYLARDSGFPGMRGVIHLTPALFSFAIAASLVTEVNGQYRTHTGHIVVGDAGHTGQATPFGGSAASADQAWIYATGDVWYAMSDLKGVMEIGGEDGGSFYVPRNEDRPLAELYGLIVFDPTVLAAAKVSVALPGGSGGSGGGGGDASAANQTAMITQLNTLLTNLGDADVNLEALEALMTTLGSNTDGLEALITTLNGHVDGLEGSATTLAALSRAIDSLGTTGTGIAPLARQRSTPTSVATGDNQLTTLASDTEGALWVHPGRSSLRLKQSWAGLTNVAYTNGDQLGNEVQFSGASYAAGWGGVVSSVVVVDEEKRLSTATASFDLYLFDEAIVGVADNSPFDDTDADMRRLIEVISFSSSDVKIHTSNSVYRKSGLAIPYTCAATSLFGILVTRTDIATAFSSGSALHVTLGLVRD